ncbi:D-xylose isomerase [Verrucomicrobium sp. GAS474]|uniref:xylose isomerase n=1 Tax=Verrucomicrobium sp. GAS474 TaxID=1882831 RepID=UPI00087A3EB7|nr:xylose isomerase [Verrucomicrobium sp. GAS474]SDT94185.1 D-xylose isomerase [Verrucomicrobium sp. GAS474]
MKKNRKPYFSVPAAAYEGPQSRNPLAFRHYNPQESFDGKTLEEHMRFSIAYWHAFRGTGADPFGPGPIVRPWEAGRDPVSVAKVRMDAAFEFFTKIRAPFWAFHDRDIAPEGKTLAESNRNLAAIVAHAKQLQKATGVKLLWGTANLFSNPRYMCGASTNPDAHVFAYAAAQVKKAMEATVELGGENYVFWGGREGYQTLLNTNLKREQDHLAAFLHMAVDYAKEIGFKGQFLIEPKPKEPTKHQYDFDVASGIAFLRTYGLEKHFKFNIETNHATLAGHSFQHEIEVAASAKALGSIDANAGDLLLGWDTDQFNTDVKELTLAMVSILKAGGLGSGGFNFDAKLRRESIDAEDLFIAHIGGMDAYALAFKTARTILKEGKFEQFVADRYASFDSGYGKEIEKKKVGFAELEKLVLGKLGEPKPRSGKQEYLENLLNTYLH